MVRKIQFAIAIVVALAILAIFIYPLTFGPPAPPQGKSPLASLLGLALVVFSLLLAPKALCGLLCTTFSGEPHSHSDRLALICISRC